MTDGQRILNLRHERGVSQEEVASALGVTRQTVSKWENDLMPISEDKQREIEKLLGIESLSAESEIAATCEKAGYSANQKIIIAVIAVLIALSCAASVIVGIVSIPNLWADERGATSMYVDCGYFWLAFGITVIITVLEVFAILMYKKENTKNSRN